jgi:hypothetical protein
MCASTRHSLPTCNFNMSILIKWRVWNNMSVIQDVLKCTHRESTTWHYWHVKKKLYWHVLIRRVCISWRGTFFGYRSHVRISCSFFFFFFFFFFLWYKLYFWYFFLKINYLLFGQPTPIILIADFSKSCIKEYQKRKKKIIKIFTSSSMSILTKHVFNFYELINNSVFKK